MADEIILVSLLVAAPFIGSFLGVVIARSGAEHLGGRSHCDHCRHVLAPIELVPLFSWLALRGRCCYCGASLSRLYPLIELAAIVPVLWAATLQEGWLLAISTLFGWCLIALSGIDVRTQRLPDILTIPLGVAGLVAAWVYNPAAIADHILGAVIGFALFWLIGVLYRTLRGREGLGLGDAKLTAALGAWVTWQGLPTVLLLAALIGIGHGVVQMRMSGRENLTQRIAFGPALALAGWIVWLYGPLVPA